MPTPNTAFPHEEFDPDFDNITTGDEGDLSVDLPGPQDDLEIDIVDDTPAADKKARPLDREVVEPTDEELATYGQNARKRIGELTHARHDERRKREALEREHNELLGAAQRMHEENSKLRKAYEEGSVEYNKVAVASVEAEVKTALERLRAANESLDPQEITEAQEALTDAKIKLVEAKKFRVPVVPQAQDVVKTASARDVQALADPKLNAWMAANRWFTAPEHEPETSYALGVHQQLVKNGFDPQSDRYYEQINARMKSKFPELFSSGARDEEPTPRRKATPSVAPVERNQPGKTRVTLTATQVNLCKKLGITPQQYAAQLASKGS